MPKPIPKRWLAKLHLAPRVCGNCRSWDLEAGQEAMRENPYFAEAASAVSPDRMGRAVYTPEYMAEVARARAAGTAVPPVPEPVRTGAKWAEFGGCERHNEGRWARDACEDWS